MLVNLINCHWWFGNEPINYAKASGKCDKTFRVVVTTAWLITFAWFNLILIWLRLWNIEFPGSRSLKENYYFVGKASDIRNESACAPQPHNNNQFRFTTVPNSCFRYPSFLHCRRGRRKSWQEEIYRQASASISIFLKFIAAWTNTFISRLNLNVRVCNSLLCSRIKSDEDGKKCRRLQKIEKLWFVSKMKSQWFSPAPSAFSINFHGIVLRSRMELPLRYRGV